MNHFSEPDVRDVVAYLLELAEDVRGASAAAPAKRP